MAALNEATSIRDVLEAVPTSICRLPTQVVVVDDGGTDETASVAESCGAVVASHAVNLGQGDALRTGFEVARRLAATVVVTMDADGQHDPRELPALVGPIVDDRADYVQGSRFLGTYDDAGGARQAGIHLFTLLINGLCGTRLTDCTNGYRAIRGAGLPRLRLVEDRFSASELIIESAAQRLRMLEVPVHIHARDAGTSRKPRGLGYPLGFLGAIGRSWGRTLLPARVP